MNRSIRLALFACAALSSLAFAGSALAVPKLFIAGQLGLSSSNPVIQLTEEKTDAAPAKVSIYTPTGYTTTLTATAGTQIGTVHADLQALAISPDAVIPADGTIIVANPATPALQTAATQCTGTPTHTAIWLLHLTVAGSTIDLPAYIDSNPTSDPLSGGASLRMVICLSSPYAEAGPSRAPSGAKLINAALTLNQNIITNPGTSGTYPWRAIVTPYTVNSGTPNAAGTVETRAIVSMPQRLSLSATVKTTRKKVKVKGKVRTKVTNSVLLSGQLREAIAGIPAVKVRIYSGASASKVTSRGTATTNADGNFSRRFGLTKRTVFQVRVAVPVRDVTSTGCTNPTGTIPCVSATAPGFTLQSIFKSASPKKR
jgi:hypothetical protein